LAANCPSLAIALSRRPCVRLEDAVDRLNADLPPLKEFILPAEVQPASRTLLHGLPSRGTLAGPPWRHGSPRAAAQYLNRLSDCCSASRRGWLNREAGQPDVLWRKDRGRA
jgi:cob(I)alamin adenosyltransferase